MVNQTSEESGLEELKRLSREIEAQGRELSLGLGRALQSMERVERKRALWAVIRDYKISLVLEQLENLAGFEVLKEVKSLKGKKSTAGLRRIIFGMVTELQKKLDVSGAPPADIPEINKKLKLLSVLLELLFYIE